MVRFSVIGFQFSVVLLLGCSSGGTVGPSELELATARSEVAAVVAFHRGEPGDPSPDDAPAGTCPDCDGLGYVGDGRIRIDCQRCDGTGKLSQESRLPSTTPPKAGPPAPCLCGCTPNNCRCSSLCTCRHCRQRAPPSQALQTDRSLKAIRPPVFTRRTRR